MLRPGVISFHVLVNNMANIKKWALLYDELWVQGISKVSPDPSHDQEAFASISWLAGQGFIKEPPIALTQTLRLTSRTGHVNSPLELRQLLYGIWTWR